MSLHFATSGEPLNILDKNDCAVWKIDIVELNSLLPTIYKKKLKDERAFIFTIDMLDELIKTVESYDIDMDGKAMVLLEPPSIDQRIINQYSYFSIVPMNMNIEEFFETTKITAIKYIIDRRLKWQIRDLLDQMNINERTAYPGLDGLASWIKRHYYVCKV